MPGKGIKKHILFRLFQKIIGQSRGISISVFYRLGPTGKVLFSVEDKDEVYYKPRLYYLSCFKLVA